MLGCGYILNDLLLLSSELFCSSSFHNFSIVICDGVGDGSDHVIRLEFELNIGIWVAFNEHRVFFLVLLDFFDDLLIEVTRVIIISS